ncbi:MAG: ABC transporter permease [Zymomonas mobilis subsp. pomaceae]|uniref:Binding-protein-dependent transport systems inner membrane component n=1 Tax=Zymomonas mobilis subsp. pomaceae (strain ATCC 29192 / DSM 22645 / JCM 10191 / CCUG 17912 / NBRC 13757 / NCIMB 11200 / NRRL B-4491 / Barker I) TaxID=579138 RepID=F8EUI2_ZYMMT|nr:ABC transporter permease [Zymomonas mobilis]AEI37198.1 binding-protein-dependent transport systems inner membrane component [Zymomonas mobilis subsp. pomaceae ATCC 29192]MDX5948568.1 ABC transporter permease [Zymomonas mobilis subsp. pomaceae]GEB88374.1 peptide ABC transporter permease [Zymomonas mobilis subsp. pomaceae]
MTYFRSLPLLLRCGITLFAAFFSVIFLNLLLNGTRAVIALHQRLAPPSLQHGFGTDALGRDIFQQVMLASGYSSLIALPAVALGLLLGVPIGLIAAVQKGWLSTCLMQSVDILFAFPALIAALLLQLLFGSGPLDALMAITLYAIPVFARVACSHGRTIATFDFITAARLSGQNRIAIAFDHILPNIKVALLTQASSQCAFAFIAEAGLAYIGIGIQPPIPSLGRMLAESQSLLTRAPWLVLWPGFMLFWIITACQMMGEGLVQYPVKGKR